MALSTVLPLLSYTTSNSRYAFFTKMMSFWVVNTEGRVVFSLSLSCSLTPRTVREVKAFEQPELTFSKIQIGVLFLKEIHSYDSVGIGWDRANTKLVTKSPFIEVIFYFLYSFYLQLLSSYTKGR
jgi:hypothetical protein